MTSLILLDAGYQNYAWGKLASESFVAKMKGLSADKTGRHYAELWVGTHPSCPSRLAGSNQSLTDFLNQNDNAKMFFSPAHEASRFNGTVPYLLKILSIKTALSIQAHPDKALAEELHAKSPDKYKDPNHKPELICALTPFEALCCFRTLPEIINFLKNIPELSKLMKAEEVAGAYLNNTSPTWPPQDSTEEKSVLKSLMRNLYESAEKNCTEALRLHLERVKSLSFDRCTEDELFTRVYDQYPDDVGCWMVYILNYVQLTPGQALFLSDSEPHAYISGDGVEIMACSDNVVRAGLTPKWKDVPTLLGMLKYNTTGLASARHERKTGADSNGWQVQYYQPPNQFPDFSLYRLQNDLEEGSGIVSIQVPTIGLGFCLEGNLTINNTMIKAGDCFAVPYGEVKFQAQNQKTLVFVASTNKLQAKSKV